jgi:hypothetical protein
VLDQHTGDTSNTTGAATDDHLLISEAARAGSLSGRDGRTPKRSAQMNILTYHFRPAPSEPRNLTLSEIYIHKSKPVAILTDANFWEAMETNDTLRNPRKSRPIPRPTGHL